MTLSRRFSLTSSLPPLLLAAAVPGLVLLSAGSSALAGPKLSGSAVYGADVEPANLDPHVTGEISADPIIRSVFDTLLYQRVDGGFEGWLAKDWSISDDGLHYHFTLREDVTFHDGTRFDAEAVVANFARLISRPPGAGSLKIVSVLDRENPVTVLGPFELVINLKTPSAGLLNQLANVNSSIVAPSAIAAFGDKLASGEGYVGTGPFRLVSRAIGTSIQLERNPDYAWAPASLDHGGPAYLDRLEIRFLPEIQARLGALGANQIHGAANIPPTLVPVVEASAAITAQETAGTSYALFLNSAKAPFDDQRVRQAFQRSLDVGTLVNAIYQGQFERAWSIASPLLPNGFDASLVGAWPQDLELSAKLLAEAGYTQKDAEGYWAKDGQRLSVEWIYNASSIREQRDVLGDAIVDDARKKGFEIKRVPLDAGSFVERRKSDDYGIADINSYNPDGDSLRLPMFHSAALPKNGGIYNYANLEDPKIDEILVAANRTAKPDERAALYAQVQQAVVLERALVVPLYTPKFLLGHGKDTGGWDISLRGVPLNFYNLHFIE